MKKKRKQRTALLKLGAVLALALFLVVVAVTMLLRTFIDGEKKSEQKTPAAEGQPTVVQTAETAEEAPAAVLTEKGFLDVTAYGDAVLPETEDAGEEYIEGTLFVGDSNTVRYYLYGATGLSNNIGVTSMGVGSITGLPCVDFNGYSNLTTIPAAIKIIQPKRVVFGFGSNNLGTGGNAESFVKTYGAAIKSCYQMYPYFTVIVNSVPALAEERGNTNLTQEQADEFNRALAAMCQENGWYFADSAAALKNPETGWAKEGYMVKDGLHLAEDGVNAVFEYLRTHAAPDVDNRPQPLASIPSHNLCPDNLLGDPIADKTKKGSVQVPVEFKVEGGGRIDGEREQKVEKGKSTSQVWAKAQEGYRFDHWEFSLAGMPDSDQEAIVITVPQDTTANGIIATAFFVEDVDEGVTLVPDIYGGVDSSQYCGYCGSAGHGFDLCPKRQADGQLD